MRIVKAIIVSLCLAIVPGNASFASVDECRKFDEYSYIICDYEVMHLLSFRDFLKNNPDLIGYLIVYGGQGERRGAAEAHAARLKDALINSLGIPAGRFTVIVGGYRQKWAVELWGCPRDANKPIPKSSIQMDGVKFRRGKIKKLEYKWSSNC
jgi:hypothetical protein